MTEKAYEQRLLDGFMNGGGRYWHMKHEHSILEDYEPDRPPEVPRES
jgi:hypothetical protein